MKKIHKEAFTLVEIIVVIVILTILTTIGFMNFSGSIADSRDTVRKSNISEIIGAMKEYKLKKGSYPYPSNSFSGTNNGSNIVFWQGKLDKNVALNTIDKIPYDPKIEIPYLYSITKNKQEFEITASLENGTGVLPLALVGGDYKSVAKNVLPTILVATSTTVDISSNKKLFIFDNQNHNLAYDFEGNLEPTSDGTDFNVLLQEAENKGTFTQNSDFEKCLEIRKAGKSIGDGEYQVRTTTGELINKTCSSM